MSKKSRMDSLKRVILFTTWSLALVAPVSAGLVGHWTFEPGEELLDRTGNFPLLALKGNASVAAGQLDVNGTGMIPTGWAITEGGAYAGPAITNKTLVSWITLQGLRDVAFAGSALTLDRVNGDHFDGIVFGERQPNRWMAGSSGFQRTRDFVPGFEETSTGALIQLAISYEHLGPTNIQVRAYRDGVLIGDYIDDAPSMWLTGNAEVALGIRHRVGTLGRGALDALIEEARVYDTVLDGAQLDALVPFKPIAATTVVITEFMANNETGIRDEDGDTEDWIELCNPGTSNINLAGWALTDDPLKPMRWVFPAIDLEAGDCLLVWASGKDRRDLDGPLHANFRIDADGEYLALVRPDGSVAQAFAPLFPPQLPDLSFGALVDDAEYLLLSTNRPVRWQVPTNDLIHTQWRDPLFDDVTWTSGPGGVGFDRPGPEAVDNPRQLDGLVLWLDGADPTTLLTNGTEVMEWLDKSSTQSHVGQSDPARRPVIGATNLNGHAVLRFDGANDFLAGPAVLASGDDTFTYFAVWRSPRIAVQVVFEQAGGGAGRRAALLQVNGRYGFNGQNNDAHTLVPMTTNAWRLNMMELNGEPTQNVRVFENGTGYTGSVNIVTQNVGVDGIRVGNKLVSNNEHLQGDIAEIIVYDRVLSANEHDAVAIYLENKYGLATSYPLTNSGDDPFTPFIGQNVESAMFNTHASIYLRYHFDATNLPPIPFARLDMRYDDGYVAYLNGTEIARRAAPLNPAWNDTATFSRGDQLAIIPEGQLEPLPAGLLQASNNVLAIHGLNLAADNPDLLFLPEFFGVDTGVIYTNSLRYFSQPTPGLPNGPGVANLGPFFVSTTESLPMLDPAQALVVTAEVAETVFAVAEVTAYFRTMFGPEQRVVMRDDGVVPDAVALDGLFTASYHATNFVAGDMVRWRFEVQDSQGHASTAPAFADPLESAQYYGTVAQTNLATTLPILEWFVENPAAARTDAGTRASLFFAGEFYDNLFVRRRGLSTLGWAKSKFKFDLNPGEHFRWSDDASRAEEFNLQSHFREIGSVSYMRENLGFAWLNEAGTDAPATFHLHLRQNGAFYGLYSFVEQVDKRFLDRTGSDDDSPLYKALQNGTLAPNPTTATYRKSNQQSEPWDDFEALTDGLSGIGTNRFLYIYDHLDLAQVINDMAAQTILPNHDRLIKNYYMVLDPRSQEWRRVPWDMEQSFAVGNKLTDDPWANVLFGDTEHWQEPCCATWFNYQHDTILDHPATREMYLRRLRSLMDQYLATSYFEDLVMAYRDHIFADAVLDHGVWGAGDIDTGVNQILTETLPTRRTALFSDPLVPGPQPSNLVIRINSLDFSPASGNQDEEYVELANTNGVSVDISGWQLDGAVSHRFKPGTVIPAGTSLFASPDVLAFRARAIAPTGGQGLFVQGPYRGHLSSRGETVLLLDAATNLVDQLAYAGSPSLAQEYLRITEIMYFPGGNGEAEYLELQNTGTNHLDLGGVHFTEGIAFSFGGSAITNLAPGAFVLVVKDLTAFTNHYGAAFTSQVAGVFVDTRLDNDGERIKLEDAQNNTIQEFAYRADGAWPHCPAGSGPSLEPLVFPLNGTEGTNWQASVSMDGSPGTASAVNPDGDCDFLPDAWELFWFGDRLADPQVDSDLDGLLNGEELITGTDPTSAASLLACRVHRLASGAVEVRFDHVVGPSYSLLGSNDFVNWAPVSFDAFDVVGTEGVFRMDTPANTTRYFRVSAE